MVTGDISTLSVLKRCVGVGGFGGMDVVGLAPPHMVRMTCLESTDRASNVSDSVRSFVGCWGMSIFDERVGDGICYYLIYKTDI